MIEELIKALMFAGFGLCNTEKIVAILPDNDALIYNMISSALDGRLTPVTTEGIYVLTRAGCRV